MQIAANKVNCRSVFSNDLDWRRRWRRRGWRCKFPPPSSRICIATLVALREISSVRTAIICCLFFDFFHNVGDYNNSGSAPVARSQVRPSVIIAEDSSRNSSDGVTIYEPNQFVVEEEAYYQQTNDSDGGGSVLVKATTEATEPHATRKAGLPLLCYYPRAYM